MPLLSHANDQRFCSISRNQGFASALLSESLHRLDFLNQGGFFGGGVCWWHARFTRNATYLARFNPNLPADDVNETKRIISKLRKADGIVEVNGYKDLQSFSRINEKYIQSELEKWQRIDGLLRQQWIVGLWGRRKLPAQKLKARMDHLYDYVKLEGRVAYLKLQLKGIAAHSWLVIDMKKLTDGYELKIIDSNFRYPISHRYTTGERSLYTDVYGSFIPYLSKKKEHEEIVKLRKSFCQAKLVSQK